MDIYSGFSHKIIVIFHSYVKLPEGKSPESCLIHHLFVDQTDQSLSVASRGHAACRRLCPGRFPATKLWYSKGIMMNHWNILPMNWNCRWLIDDDWNTLTTHHDDDDDDDDSAIGIVGCPVGYPIFRLTHLGSRHHCGNQLPQLPQSFWRILPTKKHGVLQENIGNVPSQFLKHVL